MLLSDFQLRLAAIARPPRNARSACEDHLRPLFEAAGLSADDAATTARHLALAIDLWPDTASTPLFMWIDDRSASRLPAGGLPYDLGLASFLIARPDESYLYSIWEFAERNNRINLRLHHCDVPAHYTTASALRPILTSAAPSHALYRDQPAVAFRYKPDTPTLLDAFSGPPDISGQQQFLKKRFRIDPAPGT